MELIRIKAAENARSVAIVYGVIIAIGHLVYFWAAMVFGFLHITELRVLKVLDTGDRNLLYAETIPQNQPRIFELFAQVRRNLSFDELARYRQGLNDR